MQRALANELEIINTASFELLESQLHEVYVWVDDAPLSRVKRNLNKDFADAGLMAEILQHHLPESYKHLIVLREYPHTSLYKEMKSNWIRLN